MANKQVRQPCPFCGGNNIDYSVEYDSLMFYECEDCGARGPTVQVRQRNPRKAAADAWNKRVQPPAPSGAAPAYVTPIKGLHH